MKRICIITNTEKDENGEITKDIIKYIENKGLVCVDSTNYTGIEDGSSYVDVHNIPEDVNCAVVLGGDGTIIHASHDLAPLNIPILGVNIGTLGYLADTEVNDVYSTLDLVTEGKYTVSERAMLKGRVIKENGSNYEGIVLNDIVVGRNGFSRIISLGVYVNDELVQTVRGDGVIISTPTGSTGYNLSAGGPVVKPSSKVVVITPICLHSMSNTSIVVSADDKITIKVMKSKKTQEQEAIVSFDGGYFENLDTGDVVEISRADVMTKLICTGKMGYFDVLNSKLGSR